MRSQEALDLLRSGGHPDWSRLQQLAARWQERWPPRQQPDAAVWQRLVHGRASLLRTLGSMCPTPPQPVGFPAWGRTKKPIRQLQDLPGSRSVFCVESENAALHDHVLCEVPAGRWASASAHNTMVVPLVP